MYGLISDLISYCSVGGAADLDGLISDLMSDVISDHLHLHLHEAQAQAPALGVEGAAVEDEAAGAEGDAGVCREG